MEKLTRTLAARLGRSLTTWPDAGGWLFAGGIGALTMAGMAAVGFSTGFYALQAARTEGLAVRLLVVLVAPGLGEELPFRGLLIPGRDEAPRPPWATFAVVTAVFTAWHVVEANTTMAAARGTFLRLDFLACAAILGLGCAVIRWRTGSVWPAVALHWLVVVWQTWLGGYVVGGQGL